MSALLDSLAAGFQGDAVQRAALDAALRGGLPGPRSEAWKYTSLRALERRTFRSASAAGPLDAALLAGIPAPRLMFADGVFDAAQSDLAGLPPGVTLQPLAQASGAGSAACDAQAGDAGGADAVFARLNAALARDGAWLAVDDGVQLEPPVHLVFAGSGAGGSDAAAWHLRNRIALGRDARATVVEHHVSAEPAADLCTLTTHVALAQGAALVHARVQAGAAASTWIARTDAALAAAADYRRVDLELGASLSRHDLCVQLRGQGARATANGVLFADARRHLDTRLHVGHHARDTACALQWRGLGAGRGRVAFHGGITIEAGADGSDAALSNRNLLLSEQAEIDTQPVLVIHADEVKAAHGATVGQLDPSALFYLRSRGLPEAQARRLLVAAFCREPLGGLPETLREPLEARLAAALGRIGAAA